MTETTIEIGKLRKIIREEIEGSDVKQGLNHEEVVAITAAASKLLGALEAFEMKAPQATKDALLNRCAELKPALEDMITNPSSYVMKQTPQNVSVPTGVPVMNTAQSVRIAPQGKPVLDHKQFVEGINKRLKANKRK